VGGGEGEVRRGAVVGWGREWGMLGRRMWGMLGRRMRNDEKRKER